MVGECSVLVLDDPVLPSLFLNLVSLMSSSSQGGSRSSGPQFRAYLQEEARCFGTLLEEFVVGQPSWERAGAAMARYRAQHLAWDRTIARLLRGMAEVGVLCCLLWVCRNLTAREKVAESRVLGSQQAEAASLMPAVSQQR